MPDAKSSTLIAHFVAIHENAAEMRRLIMEQIADYAANQPDNADWIFTCAKSVQDIDDCVTDLARIERSLSEISDTVLGFNNDSETGSANRRRIEVEVTEGMINQSLLTLTAAKRRGVVKLGERFRIRLPDGTEFETELIDPGNKLRERGWIREFYRKCEIQDEDRVVLEETERGVWTLSPLPAPEVDLAQFDLPTDKLESSEGENKP